MQVIKILPIDNKKSKILTDEDFDFALYNKELRIFEIEEGEDIKDEEALINHLISRARNRLFHILKSKDKTEYELRQSLKKSYYPVEVIDEVIKQVKKMGLINDESYAETYIDIYKESKSKARIISDLRKKGISRNIIDEYFEDEEVDEVAQIKVLLERKNFLQVKNNKKERDKIINFLMRRFYKYSSIKEAIQELIEEYEDE